MNIALIDTGDLFTYNLVDELEKQGCDVVVFRHDADQKVIDNSIKKSKPKLIIIAGGEEGVFRENALNVIRNYHENIPIFGVGSGMHHIVEVFEGRVDRATSVNHGKTCKVQHDGKTIFKKLPENFTAGRYNSLAATEVPYNLEVSARDDSNQVVAIRHKDFFLEGIQFHPESILTPSGSEIIANVLNEVKK